MEQIATDAEMQVEDDTQYVVTINVGGVITQTDFDAIKSFLMTNYSAELSNGVYSALYFDHGAQDLPAQLTKMLEETSGIVYVVTVIDRDSGDGLCWWLDASKPDKTRGVCDTNAHGDPIVEVEELMQQLREHTHEEVTKWAATQQPPQVPALKLV